MGIIGIHIDANSQFLYIDINRSSARHDNGKPTRHTLEQVGHTSGIITADFQGNQKSQSFMEVSLYQLRVWDSPVCLKIFRSIYCVNVSRKTQFAEIGFVDDKVYFGINRVSLQDETPIVAVGSAAGEKESPISFSRRKLLRIGTPVNLS